MVILGENIHSLSDSESTQLVSNRSLTTCLHLPSSGPLNGAAFDTNGPNPKLCQSSLWDAYRSFVCEHHATMDLLDGALHRLLFWLPHHHHSDDASPWREVLYGLLSVNQLAMYCSQQNGNDNSYGFSLATQEAPTIAATSLRIGLHAMHSLMPSILEVAGIVGDSSPTARRKRQALVRWRLEQIKVVVRMYLMFNYWRQMKQESSLNSSQSEFLTQPGIMLAGGIYHPMADSVGMSAQEWQAVRKKCSYQGRRTGLKVSSDQSYKCPSTATSASTQRVILGEILYVLRPHLWAGAEARHACASQERVAQLSSDPLLKSWLTTFAMDLLSLRLLSQECRSGNQASKEEWHRRRMKLLLYLLRSPIWTHATFPVLERTSAFLQHLPLLGRVLDSYLWDWILYWRHPFVSEEG
jgi:Peroxisomal membrane protein (Pex16)